MSKNIHNDQCRIFVSLLSKKNTTTDVDKGTSSSGQKVTKLTILLLRISSRRTILLNRAKSRIIFFPIKVIHGFILHPPQKKKRLTMLFFPLAVSNLSHWHFSNDVTWKQSLFHICVLCIQLTVSCVNMHIRVVWRHACNANRTSVAFFVTSLPKC